jgi:DNA-binding CsgD family transcriptional regulator
MKRRFEELLARLGLKRGTEPQYFKLDANLNQEMINLAEREQRPVEDVHAELVAMALTLRKANGNLWQRWESLSPREQDVTAFTCLGYTNRQMAATMGVSPETVKGYIRQTLVKFQFKSKDELRMRLESWDFCKWGRKAPD